MDASEAKIFTFVLILLLVLGTILGFFFASLIRQQKAILSLKKQNLIAELNSVEQERARIAADLHDDLAPILSAVKLKVSSFELQDESDRLQQVKTNEHLNDLLRRMREISFDLMPVTLQRKGLVAALNELISYWQNRDELNILLSAGEVPLSEAFSIHLYRIVQEIVHNTIKHARATRLEVTLRRENEKLILTAADNGKGFNYQEKLKEGAGFGLRNLLSRADALGGEIFLETAEGSGTTYTIEIPLSAS